MTTLPPRSPLHLLLRWPLPALAAWLLAWALFTAARPPWGDAAAASLALLTGAAMAWPMTLPWRRWLVALGFPLSALAAGLAGAWPAWTWLLPLALLLSAYPLRAWRDAPMFPTPARALDGLAQTIRLPAGAQLLDAGCGLGDGLRALRSAWPAAHVKGIEWSWPLALLARLRCPWARVARGDMWAGSWHGLALVYLFQRPESMARAWAKACAEMPAGAWMVSLEFTVPGRTPDVRVALGGGRELLAWRVPAQSPGPGADNPG